MWRKTRSDTTVSLDARALFVNALTGMVIVISGLLVRLSFAVAAGVGVFFGFYPAHKVTRLDPVEALRYQ